MTKTKIMGILNATPDSFFAGTRGENLDSAMALGIDLWKQGADIIDVGGESSRPYAKPVSEEEEINRVIPLIKELKIRQPLPISIDTVKPIVAEKAIAAGATLINDITGFQNRQMQELAAATKVDICVMHMQGTPQNMQDAPAYEDGIINSLLKWFETRLNQLISAGIKENQIILDPGIGFGKSVSDNIEIIQNIPKLRSLGFPVLIGASRKSFLQKIVNVPAADVLPATLTINTLAVINGAGYLRVHDVKEHRQSVNLLNQLD